MSRNSRDRLLSQGVDHEPKSTLKNRQSSRIGSLNEGSGSIKTREQQLIEMSIGSAKKCVAVLDIARGNLSIYEI